jgi:carbon storage regulator
MLVLQRKLGQEIRVGNDITLTVLQIRGDKVFIGVMAPKEVKVLRAELTPKEGTT